MESDEKSDGSGQDENSNSSQSSNQGNCNLIFSEENGLESNSSNRRIIIGKKTDVVILAGPTAPAGVSRRIQTLKPMNFEQEPLHLRCEWNNCTYETNVLDLFMEHVVSHIPSVEVNTVGSRTEVYLVCNWKTCPFKIPHSDDLKRHQYLHAYHTKLKCIGANTAQRCNLNMCRADSGNGNILPDLSDNLICAWGDCSEKFVNIQYYYNHIRYHCDDNPKGRNVPGGIHCQWAGCSGVFSNIARLRDHVRSHTQEKLLSCPICGALFANRTRFFDHCRRQTLLETHNFACEVCMKVFSTARLLRDHIRSHVNTYRCPHCDMTCSSPSSLSSHVKYRHSDEKPFRCSACPYAAKAQCDLLRHVKLHSMSEYKCKVRGCTYKSKAMASLTNHFEKVHSGTRQRKYVCHSCEKRFLRGYYLTKHLTSAHGLQWPSGHSRFRYKMGDDGLFRLFTLRYESEEAEAQPSGVNEVKVLPSTSSEGEAIIPDAQTQKNFEKIEGTGLEKEIMGLGDADVTYVVYPTNDVNIRL